MAKIQQFKNKPSPGSFGQYYYDNDDMDNFQSVEGSDSVKKPVDKYSDKSLHSYVVSDETRDYIVGNKLRFVGVSGIRINDLQVRQGGTTRKHIDTDFRGFVCDRNTFDCFDNSDNLKGYNTIYDFFRVTSEDPITNYETCQFFKLQPGNISSGGNPDFSFLEGKNIIQNLSPDLTSDLKLRSGDYLSPIDRNIDTGIENMIAASSSLWDSNVDKGNFIPFRPDDNIGLIDQSERLTSIFSEDGGSYDNYIQIVLWFKSNQGDTGNLRKRRFYVLKVNPNELMNFSTDGKATPGELANIQIVVNNDDIPHKDGHRTESDTNMAAWYLSNLSVTFIINEGIDADVYADKDQLIVNQVQPKNPISENNFDLDFTSVNLFQEPFTSATAFEVNSLDELNDYLWRKNFTPFSQITIENKFNQNLQGFKTDDLNRQICSSPTTVELNVNVARYNQKDNQFFIEKAFPYSVSPHYKVCIVHWDDVDDEFKTIQDVFDKKPTDFNEIITAQDNNTFIFKEITEIFNNNYTTPGIKKIKILVFNYVEYQNSTWLNEYKNSELPPFNKIEPIRYKLLTSRIFLDIPISEFEDFGELGGNNYRTIPWPHTNPILGGINKDSKYLKSIDDILGGGKIGNQNIIDETLLLEAKENDELGQNIEKLDLEQVRYFNKSYDISELLNINEIGTTMGNDVYLENSYLSELLTPEYYEQFDVNEDGMITNEDIDIWNNFYARPDIANEVQTILNDIQEWNNLPDEELIGQVVVVRYEGNTTVHDYYSRAEHWTGETGECVPNPEIGYTNWRGLNQNNFDTLAMLGLEQGELTPATACEIYFPNCFDGVCDAVPNEYCSWIFGEGTSNTYYTDAFDCVINKPPFETIMPPKIVNEGLLFENNLVDNGNFNQGNGINLIGNPIPTSDEFYRASPDTAENITEFNNTENAIEFTMGYEADWGWYVYNKSLELENVPIIIGQEYIVTFKWKVENFIDNDFSNLRFQLIDGGGGNTITSTHILNKSILDESDGYYVFEYTFVATSEGNQKWFRIFNPTGMINIPAKVYWKELSLQENPSTGGTIITNGDFESDANIGTYWLLNRYPRVDLGADGETYHPTEDYAIWDETNKWVEVSHYHDGNYPHGTYDNSQTWLETPSSVEVVEGKTYIIKGRVLYTGGSNNAVIELYNGVSPNGTWVAAYHSGGGEFEDLEIIFTSQKAGALSLRLAVYYETGIAYFDNIILQEYEDTYVTTPELSGWSISHSPNTGNTISLSNNQLTFNSQDNYNLYIGSSTEGYSDGNAIEHLKTYKVKIDIESISNHNPRFELGGGTNGLSLQEGMNEFEWTPDFCLYPNLCDALGSDYPYMGKVVIGRGYNSSDTAYPSNFVLNSVSIQEITYTFDGVFEQYMNPDYYDSITQQFNPHTDFNYWNGDINKFPMESSVGQIFITDNQDLNLKQSCKFELNTGELSGKSIYDSTGNSNKGLIIGDYKVKKNKKGEKMRRDSFIKVPKKTGNKDGAL